MRNLPVYNLKVAARWLMWVGLWNEMDKRLTDEVLRLIDDEVLHLLHSIYGEGGNGSQN
jgi:hypothetical protein